MVSTEVARTVKTVRELEEEFRGLNPPYGRGNGTEGAMYLGEQLIKHVLNTNVTTQAYADQRIVVLTPNGQAATELLCRASTGANASMIASRDVFGTSNYVFQHTFERLGGGKVVRVSASDTKAVMDAVDDQTSILLAEDVSNPTGRVTDLDPLREFAQERGIAFMRDGTLSFGTKKYKSEETDIIWGSATKQLGGGWNNNMGGFIVAGPNAIAPERIEQFPELAAHFTNGAGDLALPDNPLGTLLTKIGTYTGACSITPQIAVDIGLSLEGLEDRVSKMCENARMVAEILQKHPKIARVQLAGFNSDPENDERYHNYYGENHFVITFDFKSDFDAARFCDSGVGNISVQLAQNSTGLTVPFTTTNRQKSEAENHAMGVYRGTVRMSVGCEDPNLLERRVVRGLEAA